MSKKINLTTKLVLILTISGFTIPPAYLSLIYVAGFPEHNHVSDLMNICLLICMIIAVIMGFSGIFSGKTSNSEKLICFICTLLWFVFLCILLIPNYGSSREKDRRISCSSNLKQIYLALQQYAEDYAGYYPPENGASDLEVLRKNEYLTEYAICRCPSSECLHPAAGAMRGKDEGQPLTEENVHYVYIGGLNTKSDPNLPLLYDKAINHNSGNPKDFGNVLFADGTIKGIEGKPWTQNIRK